MERRNLILMGMAVVVMLLLISPTIIASWVDSGFLKFGDEDCPVTLTISLLDENGVPVNMPIINSPFFSGETEVTKIRVSVSIDVTVSPDLNWETVSLNTRIRIAPYLGDVPQTEEYVDAWTLTHQAFTGADGEYHNTHMKDYLLDDLPLLQSYVAEDGTITWKFDIHARVSGFVFDYDDVAVNAEPYEGKAGPVVLTTPPPPIPAGTFYFDAALNPWTFP